jgi:hypothetical protein
MLRNKILLVALVGIILAVVATGSASASAYHYSGTFYSKLDYVGGSYSISTPTTSSGHFYGLSAGTYIDWYNILNTSNRIQEDSISAYATQFTAPYSGLSWNQPQYSIARGTETPLQDYEVYILDSSSHSITAQHKYVVGGLPTANNYDMAFN